MATFTIKRGDTSPGLEYQTGAYADGGGAFAGATARFLMRPAASGTLAIDAAASVEDEDGVLRYAWAEGDTDTVGVHLAEFEVTYADETVETFPADGYLRVVVAQDLG